EPYDLYPNYVSLPDDASKYRYIRFTVPDVNLGRLHEIKFFNNENGIEEQISGELITSFPDDIPLLQKIIDQDVVTYVDFFSLSAEHKEMDEIWFGYDFKEPVAIDAFEFYLRGDAYLRPGTTYELLYWDFGWQSLGQKKFNGEPLMFDNVPENALYLIKIIETNRYSRIFTYINGKQKFM
ncbi:MAG TPA: hypothetical protein VEP89_12345, partial [Draconibacterium sp.]|nr:hypothetical protein [Draconibacterium sp.]